MKKIKSTLISAYACEPNKGSEPGVGWNWVLELARLGYEVHVITRTNNKTNIERGLEKLEPLPNLKFYYFDLSPFFKQIKKIPFGIYVYYFLWQWWVVDKARNIIKLSNIDVIHHLTLGAFRQPSFLYKLGKPFVFGPVGGAEMAPNTLLQSLPLKEYIYEQSRVFINFIYKFSPILHRVFNKSKIILCRTDQTLNFISSKFRNKKFIQLDIGANSRLPIFEKKKKKDDILRVLFVGRFIGWKGAHLAIDAVNKANKNQKLIEFTLIGGGAFKRDLQKRVKSSDIAFIDWLPQEELYNYYLENDCFLFPSFHDSGGSVVLEAHSFGLPVICLSLGGPKTIVRDNSGFRITVINRSVDDITTEMANALIDLHYNREKLKELSEGALTCAKDLSWHNIVKRAYTLIENEI